MIAPLLLAAGVLAPVELRGRELFLRGAGADGQAVAAAVGDAPLAGPLPCAGCHGVDGRGRAEGGVRAPEITWDALAHPSDGRATSGRKRAAYDARLLVRAIALGFDSGGNALAAPMPRYQLAREDAEALVAFLRRLGTLPEPGIADDALTIGVLLPPGRPAGVVRAAVEAWARDVNARGGLYARRVEVRYPEKPSADDEPFAFIGWGDDGVARWMAEREVPFLRTAGGTEDAAAGSPFVFETGPFPAAEVRRLVAYAAERGALPLAIAQGPRPSPWVAAAREACRLPRCRLTTDPASARAVLYLDAAAMRTAAGGALALVPSALAEEAISAPLGETVISARASPSDIDPAAAAAYRLAPARLADQWSVLATARTLEEVLRRAGAGVTRESFVAALPSVRGLATGFSPPVGTDVVRLLRLDRQGGTLTPIE